MRILRALVWGRGLALAASVGVTSAACGADAEGTTKETKEAPSSASEPGSGDERNDPAKPANDADRVTLEVSVTGTGHVVSSPAGIDCPGACTARFPQGSDVKLTAVAAEGWQFDAWGGACVASGACSVSLTTATTATKVSASLSLVDPRWDPSFGAADCASAWGTAGEKLSHCDTTPDDYVVVRKAARNVALCQAGKLVKNLRAGLGFDPIGHKDHQGDGRTPEGVYYIPRLLPNSDYYKAFLLSYPRKEDAARAIGEGLITASEKNAIDQANDACTEPPQSTDLGGDLEIHGRGSDEDWTHGCVALDDADVDLVWSTLGVGDTIVVVP